MDGVIYRGSRTDPRRGPLHPRAARPRHPVPVPDQQQPADPPRRGDQAAPAWASTSRRSTSSPAPWRPPASSPSRSPAAPRSSSARAGCSRPCTSNGYAVVDHDPDYVVVGEGRTFNLEMVEAAVRMILGGAKLIATNLDPNCPTQNGMRPGCGAIVAMLETADRRQGVQRRQAEPGHDAGRPQGTGPDDRRDDR